MTMTKIKQAADKHPIIAFYIFELIAVLPFSLSAAKPVSVIFSLFILGLYICLRYLVYRLRDENNAKFKLTVEALFTATFNVLIIFVCKNTNDILFGIFALCAFLPTAVFEIKHEYGERKSSDKGSN